MPRPSAIAPPLVPQHDVQRGNDRQPCFFQPIDRLRYPADLRGISRRAGCAVHAYVVMTGHVHLLVTPTAPAQVAHVMQVLGRRYVRYGNDRYRRTGTLQKGRYKFCTGGKRGAPAALPPLRRSEPRARGEGGRSGRPPRQHSALGQPDPLLAPHAQYLALGATPDLRPQAWRDFVSQTTSDDELDPIRQRLLRQHTLRSHRLRAMIEAQRSRAAPQKVGRPRKLTSTMEQREIRL